MVGFSAFSTGCNVAGFAVLVYNHYCPSINLGQGVCSMKNIHFSQIRLQGGFWGHYEALVRRVTVPAIYRQFADRFRALQCRKEIPAHIYWDSDVAKWIEAAAYLTQTHREPELERIVDEAVENIVHNQLPNGYFNSCYLTQMPDKIFAIRDNHELYCAGHLMEAAIAYDRATGKHAFLEAMCRYADYIYQVFYIQKSAGFFTPGHEEIELALLKLAEYTGKEKYRELAAWFIEERGRHPEEVCSSGEEAEGSNGDYFRWLTQSVQPVRQMTEAYGHAVRAGYLYTAMAALARQTGDEALMQVSKTLFQDIVDTKLSITAGVGAQIWGEAYGLAYRLSCRESYNETCAAISLAMFAWELQQQEADSRYADVIERILFNSMLSGISLSGDSFFYENALEIDLRDYDVSTRAFTPMNPGQYHDRGLLHPRRLQRAQVYTCSCCPPNISRILASVTRYMYSVDGSIVYCHQFAASEAALTIMGQPAELKLETTYPASGKLRYTYHGPSATLAIRIPAWCDGYGGRTQNGYACFPVRDGSILELELPMPVRFLEADPRVSEAAGKCAIARGPIIYCLEGIDNGSRLWDITLLENGRIAVLDSDYGVPVLEMDAFRRPDAKVLYRQKGNVHLPFTARLIPYFAFANRGITDMQIWTLTK